ncbi:MAG: thiosulfate sulfurtransferase [Bradyrhizobium sp.]|uniref:rhodanese-like domain-containing protein n=1 Tax=Bradyrhizobium sp. TaxID=376 RepID=UPI00121793EB|nr:rhodanese-like domain-containing protein [Bradyrhizobium sp.]THD60340.1 MAG: thiosulfate sulfurtransferase [Bradyrhizobium sp.]
MPGNKTKRIDARALKGQLHDGGELALLDAREELPFGSRHLLMASCVPLSRLELLVDDLVPRRSARMVWCDDGEGLAARAAERMSALGYRDVASLEGGIAAWEAAGFRVYSGVHVPSKAFAEVVEHEAGTPWISVRELQALIDGNANIAIYDSRCYEEYHNNSIPTAVSVPGAELVYRFVDLMPSPDTTVIVNCGGRTRSIIGAQSLINAGVRNKVVSLKDGTMAWHLAGLEVVHGATRKPPEVSARGLQSASEAALRVAARCGIARIDKRTLESWRAEAAQRSLYVLDVRSPEEYQAGHLRGARSAPGGQLVQETDSYLATWGARVVLVDDNGVRATMTASWLKQMGWLDIAVLAVGPADGDWETGPHMPRVLGLEAASAPHIDAMDLRARLAAGEATVIDLELSKRYAQGHIPGAWFAIRSRLGAALATLPSRQPIVLTSPDGALAALAAAELQAVASTPVMTLAGGTQAWVQAGLPLETGATRMADQADDIFLSPRERGQNREDAMREYLTWEINLVNDMARDDDHRFRLIA